MPQKPLKRVKLDDLKTVKRTITKPGEVDKKMKKTFKNPSLAATASPPPNVNVSGNDVPVDQAPPVGRRLIETVSTEFTRGRRLTEVDKPPVIPQFGECVCL